MQTLSALAPYVPLFQTALWVALVGISAFALRSHIGPVLSALRTRIQRGSSFKAGPLQVGEDLRQLDYVEPHPKHAQRALPPSKGVDWVTEREALYQASRGVFLVHVIDPSSKPGQEYDIFIYLWRHRSNDFIDIKYAEFFFGHHWGNEIFRETLSDNLIGVRTSAYGPFLCTCRVTFADGHVALLSRYIDFEMGRVFKHAA